MTDKHENPHAESVLKLAAAMQRYTLIVGPATVVVAAVVATIWVGTPGLLGALVGGVVALASALATIFMMRRSADMPVHFVMVVALGGYALKILVLFGVMAALRGVDVFHTYSLGITMLATILLTAAGEIVAFRKTKIPTIIPTS
ncbi:hypothetical protein [Amycolatopsis suaedae]|uniref:ATP synthase subunit I n=1 Tax=Amycolatopsis suaedae TaxID=2510978 RepID=A0A4Q7J1Z4_9PSEU|nr:hypothetical protein [Amycolatopsis suaedae]RZQ60889.1 hypothetical protein EWH70_27745 [Amycolatopsis suaedae]